MNAKPQRYALVGMKHRGAEALVASLPPDEPLTLVREPDNRFDKNAVQVWARGKHVGYIPKDQNAVLARFIDSNGKPFEPPADLAKDEAGMPQVWLRHALAARLHKGSNEWPLVEVV